MTMSLTQGLSMLKAAQHKGGHCDCMPEPVQKETTIGCQSRLWHPRPWMMPHLVTLKRPFAIPLRQEVCFSHQPLEYFAINPTAQ